MIGIIDYSVGNLASLSYALNDLNVEMLKSSNPDELNQCEKLILPGVGHAGYAMNKLKEKNLVEYLKNTDKPIIGICLGMQLLYESSEETDMELLGLIPGRLSKFSHSELPIVHMGWNAINEDEDAYFVHSYFAPLNEFTIGKTDYGDEFTSIVKKDQLIGFQFHPEKSGRYGLKLIKDALEENQ